MWNTHVPIQFTLWAASVTNSSNSFLVKARTPDQKVTIQLLQTARSGLVRPTSTSGWSGYGKHWPNCTSRTVSNNGKKTWVSWSVLRCVWHNYSPSAILSQKIVINFQLYDVCLSSELTKCDTHLHTERPFQFHEAILTSMRWHGVQSGNCKGREERGWADKGNSARQMMMRDRGRQGRRGEGRNGGESKNWTCTKWVWQITVLPQSKKSAWNWEHEYGKGKHE